MKEIKAERIAVEQTVLPETVDVYIVIWYYQSGAVYTHACTDHDEAQVMAKGLGSAFKADMYKTKIINQ